MKNLTTYILEALKINKDSAVINLYDKEGIYAYFKNGEISDDMEKIRKERKDVIGVACVFKKPDGKLHRMVIDKKEPGNDQIYGGYKVALDDKKICCEYDFDKAIEDFNGKKNTEYLVNEMPCKMFMAEEATKRFDGKGYLPSLGELKFVYDNFIKINQMIRICGGKELSTKRSAFYLTSTQDDNKGLYVWVVYFCVRDGYNAIRSKAQSPTPSRYRVFMPFENIKESFNIKESIKITKDSKVQTHAYHPKDREELGSLVRELIEKRGNKADLNDIDTSKVISMSYLFYDTDFDGDISEWDTSNVESMSGMFRDSKFTGKNGDISKWDVSNVKDMSGMFYDSEFNGDISKWKPTKAKRTWGMFDGCPISSSNKPDF